MIDSNGDEAQMSYGKGALQWLCLILLISQCPCLHRVNTPESVPVLIQSSPRFSASKVSDHPLTHFKSLQHLLIKAGNHIKLVDRTPENACTSDSHPNSTLIIPQPQLIYTALANNSTGLPISFPSNPTSITNPFRKPTPLIP